MPPHTTVSTALLERAARATPEAPLRVMCSACMVGEPVGFDGSSWPHEGLAQLRALPNVEVLPFCPEHFGLGTPRPWMAIHDGTGREVVDGAARIIDKAGTDVTHGFIAGGREMVRLANEHGAELAILMETSPSCARHILHRGERWPDRAYRQGMGSTATFLADAGVEVLSSRDHRSLQLLLARLDPTHEPDPTAIDVPDEPWYRDNFGSPPV